MDYSGSLDISPDAQREAPRRRRLSERLEQLSPDDYTSADLRAVLEVVGLKPVPYSRERAYTYLEKRFKAA